MNAFDRPIKYISTEKADFIIPFFQRKYVWEEKNWERLWETLISDEYENFLGSIVIKELKPNNENDRKQLSIIDGQQRFTTISILAKSLIDGMGELTDSDRKDLNSILFNIDTKRVLGGEHIEKQTKKIHHSRYDEEEFSKILNGDYSENYESISNSSSLILQCYKYFRCRIKNAEKNDEEMNSIFNNLFSKLVEDDRKSLVIITLKEKENEQAIFDSINSAGIKLTSSDIIKNSIFENLLKKCNDREAVESFYDNTWFKSFEKTEDILDLWMQKKTIGKSVEKNNLELFLQTYGTIKDIYKPTVKGYKLEDLSLYYKFKLGKMNKDEIELFIKDICKYADVYRRYFIEDVNTINEHGIKYFDNNKSEKENAINRLLQILNYSKTNTFDPLILEIIVNDVDVSKKLKELECYIVRNFVLLGQTDKNYNKECSYLLDGTHNVSYYLKENNLSDGTMDISLRSMTKNNAPKLVLYWIELYKMFVNGSDKANTELKCDFTLEHVMPQTPDEQKWPLQYNDKDEEGNQLSYETIEENKAKALAERRSLTYQIGNMTLLPGAKNSELSNESFLNKKNGFINKNGNRTQGYNNSCKCLVTNDIIAAEKWTKEEIEKRSEHLISIFKQLWPVDPNLFE